MSQTYKTERLEVKIAMDNPQERPRSFSPSRAWSLPLLLCSQCEHKERVQVESTPNKLQFAV